MTVTVSPTETQQWVKTRDNRTGRQLAVAVPSATVEGKFHLVSLTACDCKGWKYRGTCRHLTAVRAEAARCTLDADYAAAWERHAALSEEEDRLMAHAEQPYSLDVHFHLDSLRSALAACERDLDRIQRELGQVAS